MWIELFLVFVALLGYSYRKHKKGKEYWYESGIPNTNEDIEMKWGKESMFDVCIRLYNQFKGVPFFGSWSSFGKPCLVIRDDFELIKNIFIKDFDHFSMAHSMVPSYKATWPATRHEKLILNNLQSAHADEWKNLRSTFSPIFTSGKLRKMIPLLQQINSKMNAYVSKLAENDVEFETRSLTGKYSVDGIASCAFGVEAGSFDDENSEFFLHAKGAFGILTQEEDPNKKKSLLDRITRVFRIIRIVTSFIIPNVIKKAAAMFGFVDIFANFMANEHSKFLMNVIESTIIQRKTSKTKRNDLVDMMIDAINEDPRDASEDGIEDDLLPIEQWEEDSKIMGFTRKKKNLSHDDVIATALLMLSAGYDTTGTAMGYILYELALNADVQEKLLEEIREVAQDGNGIPYETLQSLPYLDAIIQETMRKHPVVPYLERLCTKDYKIPGHDYTIKKGDNVRVNNAGICFDPDIFPDPKTFKPERFLKENSGDRSPYSYMAFSLGPRNCLAMRFALIEMKMCITNLVSNFRFFDSSKTVKEVEWSPTSIFGLAKGGLWIKCEKR